MEAIYTTNDVINRCKKSIAYYDCRIKAWENVKRISKKDGSDFKVLSKNFENGYFQFEYGSNRFKVSFRDENGAYMTDDIYQPSETASGIEQQITDRVKKYKEYKTAAEYDLSVAEKTTNAVFDKLCEISEIFKASGARENGTLYYSLCNLLETNKYFEKFRKA